MRHLFFILLLSQAAVLRSFAGEPGSGVHLLPLDGDFPAEEVTIPGVEVHPFGEPVPTDIPPMSVQNRLLRDAGLDNILEWDALDRDRFFLRVQSQDANEVALRYEDQISAEKISRVKAALERLKAGQKNKGAKK